RFRSMLEVPDLRERCVQVHEAARHERDARAFGRERLCAGEADALARTRDDDDPIAQSKVHVSREGPPRPTDQPPGGQRAKRAWGDVSSYALRFTDAVKGAGARAGTRARSLSLPRATGFGPTCTPCPGCTPLGTSR